MDSPVTNSYEFGDRTTSDITIRLRNNGGRRQFFQSHSSVLKDKSKFFAERLSHPNSSTCIEIYCSDCNYDHHLELLKRLYFPEDSLVDSWASVQSALDVLPVAASFNCEKIVESCIEYLEAVPWDDKEEELVLKAVQKLGPIAMPILARIQPVDLSATKNVFISAIRFATSGNEACPPFGDELKTSAQEQIEYMLGDDDDIPLVKADEEVTSEIKRGLSRICSCFEREVSSLLLQVDLASEAAADKRAMESLSDLEWICNIVHKMDLMKDFVNNWADISNNIKMVVEDKKLDSIMWGLKVKIIELTGKVLDSVGYGNVIVPSASRVELLKIWLPYIRKMKPLLDSYGHPYKMDEEVCERIEGAIVALISGLPSNDQADILADWMSSEQVKYPDLSEAFEVWCYRTKSAKRRLMETTDTVVQPTLSL